MRAFIPVAVLSAIALVAEATLGPDSPSHLTASIPCHLIMLFGLNGIAMLSGRFVQVGPVHIDDLAPNSIRRMTFVRGSAVIAVGLIALTSSSASALSVSSLVISEVMFNPTGGDDRGEWVELYNGTDADIDLTGYSIGWGGADYTTGTLQLSGAVGSGATYVVGGPLSDAENGNPIYDLALDFGPNLQNGGRFADGVALFDVPAVSITPATTPIDAVIYGILNLNGLIDESGTPGAIDYFGFGVGFGAAGSSIELGDSGWLRQLAPTPGSASALTPEPGTAITLGMGLAMLAMRRRHTN